MEDGKPGSHITSLTVQKSQARIIIAAFLGAVLIFYTLFPSQLTAQEASTNTNRQNALISISSGTGNDYRRLAFTFKEPIDNYILRRTDVNQLSIDFGPIALTDELSAPPSDIISSVTFSYEDKNLIAQVILNTMRYELRHFTSRDKYSLVIDIKNLESGAIKNEKGTEEPSPLELPSLKSVAAHASLLEPPTPHDDNPERLFQRILKYIDNWNLDAALKDMDEFRKSFPTHPLNEPIVYLYGDVKLASGPVADTYMDATNAWTEALNRWPQSSMAQRAKFMKAEADRLMGYQNESSAQFKLLATDTSAGQTVYTQLATLRAADLLMNMGLIDDARKVLVTALESGTENRLGLESYARLGMANFYEGLYSQANEIFREVLKQAPHFYSTYPEMLYAAGEGYHYLGRPDLSRMFLLHALNLMPDHPKADVILARVGDNYRKEKRDNEAMAIYGTAMRHYPDGDGGVISQVRLAEMGALHSFFKQENVFDSLEWGARQATVEMYKKIIDSDSPSPLLQLAYLKIGLALAEDGATAEAIKWLRDLDMKYPKSALMPEALPVLSKSIVNETYLQAELGNWQGVSDLYADSSSYLSDADRPKVQRVVAVAYEKLGRFDDARDVWAAIEEQTPEKRLAKDQGLIISSLKIGAPMDALEYLAKMAKEFPEQKAWIDEQAKLIGAAIAKPANSEAVTNLIKFRSLISSEPARQDALYTAIGIEMDGQNYDKASALMNSYRQDYPDDELTPQYLILQSKIEDRQKRYQKSWDLLSQYRQNYPDDPKGAEFLKEQIAKAGQLGMTDDAFRFMEQFRLLYPNDPESRQMMIKKMQQEWDMGRYEDSQNTFDSFCAAYPSEPSIPALLAQRAKNDWDKERYAETDKALEWALLNYPQDPQTVQGLIDIANKDWDRGRYDQSQNRTDLITRLYPSSPKLADLLLKRANDEWDRKRYPQGRRQWEDFRRLFPNDTRIGQSYLNQYKKEFGSGFTKEAFALADLFRKLKPEDPIQPDLLLEQAKDLFTLGRPNEGLAMWDSFRHNYPNDPRTEELLLIQARQELKSNQLDKSLAHYQEFIDKYPNKNSTAAVYIEAAAAEAKSGRLQQAWAHLDQYQKKYPDHEGRPKALLDQIEIGKSLGLTGQAVELYKLFRHDYPQNPQVPPTYLAQARLEIAAGQSNEAIATLEEGILSNPQLDNDPQVQALLTDLYLETGSVEKWADLVEKNLGRDPNPKANLKDRFSKYHQLALVNQQLGHMDKAERNFDAAIANRSPDTSPETLYAIAGAYKKMMRQDKYASTLALVRDSGDQFWQKVAADELNSLPAAPPQQQPAP